MKKTVILSTNNSPHYFFYIPIAEWLWNKFGWEIALFHTSDCNDIIFRNETTKSYIIPDVAGVRTNTLAQVVRHFASDVLPKEDYLMVQDIDLLPLKEWNPDLNARSIYGWELTGYSFIPVHYTGMTGDKWYDLMDCTGDLATDMEREMKANGRAYQKEWNQYWDTDWDILTKKVLAKKEQFDFIDRGMKELGKYSTAKGRIDRCSIEVSADGSYHWGYTEIQTDYIDMHCENNFPASPEKWEMIRAVLIKVFGDIPDWMDEYVINHHNKYEK